MDGRAVPGGNPEVWPDWWSAAARRYGTPLYVYDLPTVRDQVSALRRVLPPQARVAYAVKANANLALVDELRRLGCGADVASLGELETVRAAGFEPADVLFTGPAKTDRELAEAIAWGIGLVVVESVAEAARVSAIGARCARRQPVLLRVNPGAGLPRTGMAITSPRCKFGVDEADVAGAIRDVAALPQVDLRGIHLSTESNVCSADRLLERARYGLRLAARMRADGCPVEIVDLGGGHGVPYLASDPPLDLDAYGYGLRDLAGRYPPVSLVLELGRYLVAESGTYLVSVVAVKRSPSGTFVLVDGGINHLYRPILSPPDRPPPVLTTSTGPLETVTVGGPLLDSDDLLAGGVALPRSTVGDLLAIPRSGAYGYAHGLHAFCLHPTPAEVVWDGHRLHLVRERGDPTRVTEGQHRLPSPEVAAR